MTIRQPAEPIQEQLNTLRQAYLKKLSFQVIGLRRLQELILQGFMPVAEVQNLFRTTHNFSGSGTTFGFPAISESARTLHVLVKEYLNSNKTQFKDEAEKADFLQRLRAFEQSCRDAMNEQDVAADTLTKPVAVAKQQDSEKRVLVVSSRAGVGEPIAKQLSHFNYSVSLLEGPDSLAKIHTQSHECDVLVLFTDLQVRDVINLEKFQEKYSDTALIVVSPVEDFECRLSAARLGAKAYFTDDIDILKIVDKIEQVFTARIQMPPYRILIVDDDDILAEYYSKTIEHHGMKTTLASNAKDCMKIITSEPVDLILIDYDMPHCNGQELANVIRQHDQFISLPIVFMSAKEDIEAELINTSLGIDDFLVKPFSLEQMVSVIQSRAERAAQLQGFMVRDSFTGLYNHKHFLETLANELMFVKRNNRKYTYAMIDIDHFKRINDTYGHATGDKVIKGLALTLQQLLRRSDIIGRCGGEEFGILMPECTIQYAHSVMEKIRIKFSELVFSAPQDLSGITFSGGLIELTPEMSVDQAVKMADDALYEAKKNGRNQLVLGNGSLQDE